MWVLKFISTWPASRWPWFILASSAAALESAALYFQYFMGLEPCVMCIYQRVAVMGLFLACLPALVAPQYSITRLISFALWGVSAAWGASIAYEHVLMQDPSNFLLALSCDVIPNFPNWLPLHKWIPSIFEARGTCGTIDWQFIGLSMPTWMLVTFTSYLAVLVSILVCRMAFQKKL